MSLALIAGSGRLPELLIARAEAPQVFALEDQAPALPVPVQTFRLETFGTLIARMVETGVTELCLAGAIYRPAIDPTRIDPATAPLMPRLAAAIGKGDAGALGVVTDLFEEAGLHIVGAHHLRPDLLPAAGVPTRTQPQDRHGADADRAAGVVAALGAADVGQGCVVAQRQVLAVEALPGTDGMLAGLRDRPAWLPPGGLLFKAPKPGQDRRIDLPTIGADTVRNAAAAGLEGIVIEAGGVLMLDAEATIDEADENGLFIWIREP